MHAGDLRPCDTKASCVSSSSIRSPSQYMPAWDFAPTERDQAFTDVVSVVRELQDDGDAQLLEADRDKGYVKARLRYDLKGILVCLWSWHVSKLCDDSCPPIGLIGVGDDGAQERIAVTSNLIYRKG